MSGHDLDKHIRAHVPGDRLSAEVAVAPGCPPVLLTRESVAAVLEAQGISPARIDRNAVEELVARARAAPGAEVTLVVARGLPASNGEDGRFEPDPDILAAVEQARVVRDSADERARAAAQRRREKNSAGQTHGDGDDTPDHYARSAFVVVERGRTIGRFIPPSDGGDGVDVYGRAIPAHPGHESRVRLVNVDRRPGGGVVAAASGSLSLEAELIRVDETLEIEGGVDFSTGNIDFPGPVTIAGGIRDCFQVKAAGDLEIRGLVEAATVLSHGSVRLTGGFAGHEKGTVRCDGDLEARYLDACRADVGGDLRVEREINACHLRVEGAVDAPRCAVRGGELRVAGACTLGEVGGAGGTHTTLFLGVLDDLEELLAKAAEILPEVERRAADAEAKLAQLSVNVKRLPPQVAEQLTELQFLANDSRSIAQRVEEALGRLSHVYATQTRPCIDVAHTIHAGTRIHLRGWLAEFRDDVPGPVRLILDDAHAPILVDPRSGSPIPPAGRVRLIPDDALRALKLPDDHAALTQGQNLAA